MASQWLPEDVPLYDPSHTGTLVLFRNAPRTCHDGPTHYPRGKNQEAAAVDPAETYRYEHYDPLWRKASASVGSGACVEVAWRKSSHSNSFANCVEVAWRTACHNLETACVEVAPGRGEVLVRDSKDTDGPRLAFSPGGWSEFLAAVKAGELA
jgi:hypothetical protein